MTVQFIRACSLIVADDTGNGIELAGPDLNDVLRIRFTINYQIVATPASLKARIYNLSVPTIQKLVGLASKNAPTNTGLPFPTSARATLKAGYAGNIGMIFQGTIYQMRVGRERNTDSYLDIFAADGDMAHNYATVNKTFAKGHTAGDLLKAVHDSFNPYQVTAGDPPHGLSTAPSVRGRAIFGMSRDVLREMGASNNFTWNILNNRLETVPKFAPRPGDPLEVNSGTGMIGVPEQTENGVSVTTLLNPAIRWGTQIKLNNNEIDFLVFQQFTEDHAASVTTTPTLTKQGSPIPPLNADGNYVVLHANHVGDTRGNEWYTHMACISIDHTALLPPAANNILLPPPLAPLG